MSDDARAFTAERVLALTQLTKRQLQYWDEQGFIRPSLTSRSGRGRRRLYDFRDLVSLRLAAQLRASGVSLREIRRVDRHLRGLDYAKPLAEVRMWRWRGRLYFSEKETVRAGKTPEQVMILIDLPFKATVEALESDIAKHDQRPIGKIERRRGALGHKRLIAGTRIPVASIRRLAEDGLDSAGIRGLYPDLHDEDIRSALSPEAPRPARREACP